MRISALCLLLLLVSSLCPAYAQGTVPTFTFHVGQKSYTLAGRDPVQGGSTTIPTVLVPVTLSFESKKVNGQPFVMDATADTKSVLDSPVFSPFRFSSSGEATQYADAILRATFPKNDSWHTLLGKPEIKPLNIDIPVGYGYILTSVKTGGALAVVDADFLQGQIFKQIPRQDGKLVIAVARNTTFYVDGDATICCSWGTHGIDAATGTSFVLGSYLNGTPGVVAEKDVQPITQQLAEFIYDPKHDPQRYGYNVTAPGNTVTRWLNPTNKNDCGGPGIASAYFLLEPTDNNPKNTIPTSRPFVAQADGGVYHLQNVALLPWYTGATDGLGSTFSFPDAQVLTAAATPCPAHNRWAKEDKTGKPAVAAVSSNKPENGHKLIGYWTGRGIGNAPFPLRDVSPQWDIIIVAFATPDKDSPEGTLKFHVPDGLDDAGVKADIASLKRQGKKVMLSLGGGGQYFALNDPAHIPNFVSSVTRIVSEYGFDGIDIDFESPSLLLQPGDTDFRHPTTPSIVNLIAGLRQLHDHFGSGFMISLVPEGPQIPAGYPSYGGQFGSYLPIVEALRDILSFVDIQDYNTPPLEGLDGEVYQAHTVDYHAAMTDMLLHGFNVGGDPDHFFSPLDARKVAVGFLTDYDVPAIVSQAMDYIITGKAPAGTTYKLQAPGGYPGMIGAMFWTIDDDRRAGYIFSNVIGPQLHGYSPN